MIVTSSPDDAPHKQILCLGPSGIHGGFLAYAYLHSRPGGSISVSSTSHATSVCLEGILMQLLCVFLSYQSTLLRHDRTINNDCGYQFDRYYRNLRHTILHYPWHGKFCLGASLLIFHLLFQETFNFQTLSVNSHAVDRCNWTILIFIDHTVSDLQPPITVNHNLIIGNWVGLLISTWIQWIHLFSLLN